MVALPANLAVLPGLAFHELATNAAKYGALSDIAGVLTVTWQVEVEQGTRIPHSGYIDQANLDEMQRQSRGEFVGVGLRQASYQPKRAQQADRNHDYS